MRRKRRIRPTWLPNVGSQTGVPGQIYQGVIISSLTVAANSAGTVGGPITQFIFPLVQDTPLEPEAAGATVGGQLARIVGQEYKLERIVGNAFVQLNDESDPGEPSPGAALVTLGFFVARADDNDDVPAGDQLPIGANAASAVENYSPLSIETVREPWIYRRSWVLATGSATGGREFQWGHFPQVNAFYGSLAEGTKVDAKSVRRIGNDDRLWGIISAMSLSVNDFQDGNLSFLLDFRALGFLQRAHNKSTF